MDGTWPFPKSYLRSGQSGPGAFYSSQTLEFHAVSRLSDFGELVHSQIHHFSDASELGYGTVSYLSLSRMTNAEGKVHVAFLMAKAKVAPLKWQTIPRLELAAAALSVKVVQEHATRRTVTTYK